MAYELDLCVSKLEDSIRSISNFLSILKYQIDILADSLDTIADAQYILSKKMETENEDDND